MEIWKNISELNGKYQCSNLGRIRRINKDERSQKYKYLKFSETKCGYLSVNPTLNYRKRVHRIVAELFLDNNENKPYVNHKDLNKKNNNVSNLEWVTASENSQHAQDNGKLGRMQLKILDINTNKIYNSLKTACKELNYKYKYASYILSKNGFYKNLYKIEKTYQNIS